MLCVEASRIPEAPALEMNEANMPHSEPLPRQPDEPAEASSTTNKVRQGVTGHNVRYVLLFGTAGAVLAFILVFVAFFG